jgi:hypothetical protein
MKLVDFHLGFEIRTFRDTNSHPGLAVKRVVAERGRLTVYANTEAGAREEIDRLIEEYRTDEGEAQGVPEEKHTGDALHRPAKLRDVELLN